MIDFSKDRIEPRETGAKFGPLHILHKRTAAAVFATAMLAAGMSGTPAAADTAGKKASSAPVNIVPAQDRPVEEFSDPLEPVNRVVFAVNDGLDLVIIRPIASVYKTILPTFVRRGIGNFLSNVATPITLANDLLQGEWLRAENTMVRFMLNSTAGLGGLSDVAKHVGYQRHTEDFGQTLAVYGVPSGPYVVLPILGPATPRHALGRVVDTFANPWFWLLADEETIVRLTPGAVSVVNARAESLESLDAIRETSPDYYVSIRSLYTQSRESEIRNGEDNDEDLPDIPDVDG